MISNSKYKVSIPSQMKTAYRPDMDYFFSRTVWTVIKRFNIYTSKGDMARHGQMTYVCLCFGSQEDPIDNLPVN